MSKYFEQGGRDGRPVRISQQFIAVVGSNPHLGPILTCFKMGVFMSPVSPIFQIC